MIKLYIFNLEEFLYLADRCSGPVNLLSEGGKVCGYQKQLQCSKEFVSRAPREWGTFIPWPEDSECKRLLSSGEFLYWRYVNRYFIIIKASRRLEKFCGFSCSVQGNSYGGEETNRAKSYNYKAPRDDTQKVFSPFLPKTFPDGQSILP